MKLFLREHLLLIFVQIIQLITIVGLFWLAGFRSLPIALYSLFLSFFFLTGYLIYQYISRREFYKCLTHSIESMDESLQNIGHAPVSQALTNVLRTQYNEYNRQITHVNNKQVEYLLFMDRWIHQMKTPVSVIELTAAELDEPDSSSIREETDRLKAGLNTVLYMSRLRTIEQDFHIKQVELYPLVQEVSTENKRLFIRHKVYPKIDNKQDIVVESDEKWLFFIMNQLIHNAVKYSTEQADHIIISLEQTDEQRMIEVKDFGVGIPKEDIGRIFDAFYTGENGRKFRESTGVGLYLVSEVAQYLGHQLEVESTIGKGATFRILF